MASKKVSLGQFYTSAEVCDFMVSLADAPTDAAVIEAGHGEGAFLDALLRAGYRDLTAYDIDPYNHEFIGKRFSGRVKAVLGDYLHSPKEEKVRLVIGNPPYVSWGNLSTDSKQFLLTDPFWKQLANGQWDLLYAFLIWSAERLEVGGELIQIVPFNWFNSTYAASLRDYLAANGRFEAVIHFGEFKLFDDAYPNCIIFKWRKGGEAKHFFVADYPQRSGSVAEVIAELAEQWRRRPSGSFDKEKGGWHLFSQEAFQANGQPWYLASPKARKQVEAIEDRCGGRTLADQADVAVGVVSGLDQAFLLDDTQIAALPKSECSLIRSFVKASGCERFRVSSTTPMLFTEGIADEETLKKQFPTVYSHLFPFKEQLGARYLPASKRWWEWATVRNMPFFERNSDKGVIFIPGRDRSKIARFAYSAENLLSAGDVVAIAPKASSVLDPLYLLAWLTSSYVQEWWKIKGARSGERNLYTQVYLTTIPLRTIDHGDPVEQAIHDQIVAAMKEIVVGEGDEATVQQLLAKLMA